MIKLACAVLGGISVVAGVFMYASNDALSGLNGLGLAALGGAGTAAAAALGTVVTVVVPTAIIAAVVKRQDKKHVQQTGFHDSTAGAKAMLWSMFAVPALALTGVIAGGIGGFVTLDNTLPKLAQPAKPPIYDEAPYRQTQSLPPAAISVAAARAVQLPVPVPAATLG